MDYKEAASSLTAKNGRNTYDLQFKVSDFQPNKQENTHLFDQNEELPGASSMAEIIHDEVTKKKPPRWAKAFLDYSLPIPPVPPALISINGTEVAFRGGITSIAGADKAGKSTLVRAILASVLSGKPIIGIEAEKGIKVVDFDTEQPSFRILHLIDNAFHIAEKKRVQIPDINVLQLRPYSPAERLQAVTETIEDVRPDIVILDGVTDLIPDINDLSTSADLIARLLTIATDMDVCVVAVIHTNPNDPHGKLRGHLGSELMRKSETSILLEKSGSGVFTCRCKASRGKPFDAFSFMKDDDDNLLLIDAPVKAVSAPDKLLQAMESGHAYTHTELVALASSQGVTTSSAKYAINKNMTSGWLIKDGKYYKLKEDEKVSPFSLI